ARRAVSTMSGRPAVVRAQVHPAHGTADSVTLTGTVAHLSVRLGLHEAVTTLRFVVFRGRGGSNCVSGETVHDSAPAGPRAPIWTSGSVARSRPALWADRWSEVSAGRCSGAGRLQSSRSAP